MPRFIPPTADLHGSWLEAHTEWGPGLHEDGFGIEAGDEVNSSSGFAAWMERLKTDNQCTYRWIADGRQVLGAIALRHSGHPLISRAGHLGYGIRPSARGRGLATWAVGRMLREAQGLGMDHLLAVCLSGNRASQRTLEANGAVLDGVSGDGSALFYRIGTSGIAAQHGGPPSFTPPFLYPPEPDRVNGPAATPALNRRTRMATVPGPLDHTFTAPIGVKVKGDVWSCVEMPGSAEFFGTGKTVKVAATVDEEPIRGGLMPTGQGGHMLSISAKLRKKLGKDIGDTVTVRLTERLS
ncbi:GNAT family N-acetyltransferase [Arthrobacter sp. 3Tela_A]